MIAFHPLPFFHGRVAVLEGGSRQLLILCGASWLGLKSAAVTRIHVYMYIYILSDLEFGGASAVSYRGTVGGTVLDCMGIG